MNRHPFRWEGLAFGAFFLAVAGNWAVWREDLLTRTEMSYLVSSVLIVLGVAGVVATFWKPRHPTAAPERADTLPADTRPTDTEPVTDDTIQIEEIHHEASDPKH